MSPQSKIAAEKIAAEKIAAETGAAEKIAAETGAPDSSVQAKLDSVSASKIEATVSGDSNSVEFLRLCAELDAEIRTQTKSYVRFRSRRGDKARAALNVKLQMGRSSDSRKALRKAAMIVLENTALAAYDPTYEQVPDLDKWMGTSAVCAMFPDALDLASAEACEKLIPMFTRIDPPRSWDAPEEWELKRQYKGKEDDIRAMIARAAKEAWTGLQMREGIDLINGAMASEAPKSKAELDPIKAARTLAIKIMESITAQTVDAETLFDELQSQLTRFGWELVKGHDGKGTDTLKPVKLVRTPIEVKESA